MRRILSIWLFSGELLLAGSPQDAQQLLRQAKSLSGAEEVITIGTDGLLIEGTTLTGSGVQRPSLLRTRAAEILAEKYGQAQNARMFEKEVLSHWYRQGDYRTPVGFLRHFAKQSVSRKEEFRHFCQTELALCYLKQGDEMSAAKIFGQMAREELTDYQLARGQAYYARYLLKQGAFDQARELATRIKEKAPRRDMEWAADDAVSIALSVLANLPTTNSDGQNSTPSFSEAEALAEAKANPRRYRDLGKSALQAGDWQRAIEFWQKYRKHFSQEEGARALGIRIGELYAEQAKTKEALAAYKTVWTAYPEHREAWQALLKSAEVHEATGEQKEALELLEKGQAKVKTGEGKAWLIAKQGEIYARQGQAEKAFEQYVILLSQYGDQDAAQGTHQRLETLARKSRDRDKITDLIKDWLMGKGQSDQVGKMGQARLNLQARSELRRLGLQFFIRDLEDRDGERWLKAIGYVSEETERDWVIRDEAWFYAGLAERHLENKTKISSRDLDDATELGIKAWKIAPSTEEGWSGLRAAHELAMLKQAGRGSRKDVIEQLQALQQTQHGKVAKEMLLTLYQATGDEKKAKKLLGQ